MIGPRPLRLDVVGVDEQESQESRFCEDLGCNTWQMGGVGTLNNGSSVGSLVDIVKTGVAREGLRAGPASGEERNGLVLATWPSADFGRRACVTGGMSSGPELCWSVFQRYLVYVFLPSIDCYNRSYMSILAWKKEKKGCRVSPVCSSSREGIEGRT